MTTNDEIIKKQGLEIDTDYLDVYNEMLNEARVDTENRLLKEISKLVIKSDESRDYFLRAEVNRKYVLIEAEDYKDFKKKYNVEE